jgi:hypothetical protein
MRHWALFCYTKFTMTERPKNPDTHLESAILQDPAFEQAVGALLDGNRDYSSTARLLTQAYDRIDLEHEYDIYPDDVIEAVRTVFRRAGRESELDKVLTEYELAAMWDA